MNNRQMLRYSLAMIALSGGAGAAWLLSLPPGRKSRIAPPIKQAEKDAMIAALRPPKRSCPLIAILGANDGSETTDYLMPYGILRRAGVADVIALGMMPGPIRLYPALKVLPQATVAHFDARHPEGADYVIVPAMRRDDDPAILGWIKRQSSKGATIIGVCAGAKVVANAGLLDGRWATTHWYYLDTMRARHPAIHYIPDRRLVVDRGVVTTTGITASMPLSLTLIEAIAGRELASAIAENLGVMDWDARHDSSTFQFTRPFALTAICNRLSFWKHEWLGLMLEADTDEVSLALLADAWSRTYHSSVVTLASAAGALPTRHGILVLPDRALVDWPGKQRVMLVARQKPAQVLDEALLTIAARYGERTADFVAMQLEYSRESPQSWANEI